ncbi:probable LRR receptor-like serine/threonine-protein kinase At1g51880 [Abrus precatorius]|uniref:non-specific serine/threonine protein kinase n=1 Tax=Abrus precatorius TaxID=3816 RepID=A0A8B8K1J8_ABRPR|nr:probable LRR receptor-like serine/threonine-protein kinase At1g51880 [Abrus precatorius]
MEIGPQWIVSSKLNTWLWFVLVPIFITHANSRLGKPVGREITNDNHPDFISIDCGSHRDYWDQATGIWYQTDEGFVETGTNHMISSSVHLSYRYFGEQLNTLRSFPEGDRNCYTLKPKQGKNNSYLIRAFFAYGNYDSKNETPSFDLYIGVNYWHTINEDQHHFIFAEVIHTPSSDTIQLCLVKTGPTIPYISTLVLRPLNNSIYQTMSSTTSQPLLDHQTRIDVGFHGWPIHSRYKDDVYDRLWRHDQYNVTNGWHPLDESIDVDPSTSAYKLPSQVLRTASQSPNVSYPLKFDYDTLFKDLDTNYEYRVYFHFAEIEALPPGQNRIINITLNSKPFLSHPLVLQYMKPVTISPQDAVRGRISFSISATPESAAPPILNAFEAYKLIPGLYSPTDARDAAAIMDIKSAYHITWLNWQGDPCLPKQFAWEGLTCNSDTNPRITALNLSSSKLTGEINISFSYLTELEILDLSNNYLEGPVPEFLAELPKLKLLNLTGNKLSGPIPKALKKKADTTLQLSCSNTFDYVDSNTQEVTYGEILSITNNLERVVGKGGYGTVYYGCIGERQVAVKMLSPSTQGFQQFQTEAKILTRVHQKCLTPLIGYCNEASALIYKYMPNGNLADHLSDKNQFSLVWNQRLQIALDSAIGLEYLHKCCKPPIVHRDVKTSNILLDENFNAKISDFGLSRIFSNECDTHVLTKVAGTPGYFDPEYYKTNKLTEKSDVYSFGIVLLEIITGHPAIFKNHENTHIVQWVNSMLEDEGEIDTIMDPRLQGTYDTGTASKVVDVAMACVAPSSIKRPTMNEVMIELKQCFPMENLDCSSSIESSVAPSISGKSSLER